MISSEPAGEEEGKGKSAELSSRARLYGGSGEKIPGTVRGGKPRGRYPLTENSPLSAWVCCR